MMKQYLGCVGEQAGMEWIDVLTGIRDVMGDFIMHFGSSSVNAFLVRERDPPGSRVEITRLGR